MTDKTEETPLNQGQQAAADGFFEALMGGVKELSISGPGGVGKTFLMGYLIDKIMPRYFEACSLLNIKPEFTSVAMTATTNKAAEELALSTGRETFTTHSFFNLKVVDDYATGKSRITKSGSWKVHQNMIIFIDEASMVDRQLLGMIREGTCNCMVVWVGDHCQMAPVMESISPIYEGSLPFYELTEPMRTNNPHLQALNLQLRQTVETGVFNPIKLVPGIIDWLDDQAMEAELCNTFAQGAGDNRVLAYTNQRVMQYNDYIRDYRRLPSTYQVGERLINNSAVQLSNSMISVEAEVEIVRLDSQTTMVPIDNNVELEIRYADLSTRYGSMFTGVMLPEDRAHYEQLVKYYKTQKNWNRYYHLKNKYPDLRPRDASTVYKAQGSSYGTVFVDVGNLSTCHNPNQAARMLYVACSRARHRVVFYGTLAEKYGGLVY